MYFSSDFGKSWNSINILINGITQQSGIIANKNWQCVSISSTGQYITAVGLTTSQGPDYIYTSYPDYELYGELYLASSNITLGNFSGWTGQGSNSIAIGTQAGYWNQGDNSIAIGAQAGFTAQSNNSIILNATGSPLNAGTTGFFVAPVRGATASNYLYYDVSSSEVRYSNYRIQGRMTSETIDVVNTTVINIGNTPQITNIINNSGGNGNFNLILNNSNICPTIKYINYKTNLNRTISINSSFIPIGDPTIFPITTFTTSTNFATLKLLCGASGPPNSDWFVQKNNGFTLS